MDMRALRGRVIKFSVDGFWRISSGRLYAPRAPVSLEGDGQQAADFDNGISGLAVSDLHSSSPGGRPGSATWAPGPRTGARRCVCRPKMVRHPQTVSAWRPARCLVVLGTALAIPVNRYSREFETVQSGCLSQSGCQLKPTRQRRNWRVRAVERGPRSEPAWLRELPGRAHFEPEKLPGTQIRRNVWDRSAAGKGDGVNDLSARKLRFWKVAPQKDEFHTTSQGRKLLKRNGERLAIRNSGKSRDKALLQRLVEGVNGRKPDLIRRGVGAGIKLSRPVDISQQEAR